MTILRNSARTFRAATLVLLLAFSGCKANQPAAQHDAATQPSSPAQTAPQPTAQGQPFDFYLLNLSWSPDFCSTHRNSPECASHPGFVVHGLWPQNNDGGYPENCPSRPTFTSDAAWQGLMPTASLAQHEWDTHGTCTPYDADTYFGLIRKAYQQVKIPEDFTGATEVKMEPPVVILGLFSAANPSFPAASFALSCGNNNLTAVEVCFDKDMHPADCRGVHSCKANNVKVTPQ